VDINALLSQISQNITEIARETGMMEPRGSDGDSRAAAEAAQAAMDAQLANRQKDYEVNPGQHRLAKPALRAPGSDIARSTSKTVRLNDTTDMVVDVEEPPREVTLDIDLRFRDIKAAVPLYTTDLSVRNNALIRPIVAFIK
jgi:mitochondrial distribution and morphology protein 31